MGSSNIRDIHTLPWIILIFFVAALLLGFFRSALIKIMAISVSFMIFYIVNPIIFDVRGRATPVTILSGGKFTKRWKAFPVFIFEMILLALLADWLSVYLESIIDISASDVIIQDLILTPIVIFWLVGMFLFYWYRVSKKKGF